MNRCLAAAALVTLLSAARPGEALAAELPPPGGPLELTGARSMGTGAATAGTTGTEGIFANPGAVGVRTGYVAEALGVLERRGASTSARYAGLAVVDAVSAPVAFSVAYLASSAGERQGHLLYLGMAGPISERMHLGIQGHWVKLGGPEPVNTITADAGLNWQLTDLVTLGVAGFNLTPTHHPTLLPQAMGAGLAVGSDTFIRVQADWRGAFLPHGQLANRYAAGAAGLLGGMWVLRAGFIRDEAPKTSWWSSGLGVVTGDGFSLDVGFKQAFGAPSAREMALSLRYFPPQP
jgi:hypothetical protein